MKGTSMIYPRMYFEQLHGYRLPNTPQTNPLLKRTRLDLKNLAKNGVEY
jgi:hypothetical protein